MFIVTFLRSEQYIFYVWLTIFSVLKIAKINKNHQNMPEHRPPWPGRIQAAENMFLFRISGTGGFHKIKVVLRSSRYFCGLKGIFDAWMSIFSVLKNHEKSSKICPSSARHDREDPGIWKHVFDPCLGNRWVSQFFSSFLFIVMLLRFEWCIWCMTGIFSMCSKSQKSSKIIKIILSSGREDSGTRKHVFLQYHGNGWVS